MGELHHSFLLPLFTLWCPESILLPEYKVQVTDFDTQSSRVHCNIPLPEYTSILHIIVAGSSNFEIIELHFPAEVFLDFQGIQSFVCHKARKCSNRKHITSHQLLLQPVCATSLCTSESVLFSRKLGLCLDLYLCPLRSPCRVTVFLSDPQRIERARLELLVLREDINGSQWVALVSFRDMVGIRDTPLLC